MRLAGYIARNLIDRLDNAADRAIGQTARPRPDERGEIEGRIVKVVLELIERHRDPRQESEGSDGPP
jgi:hypothetical protein